MFVNTQGFKAGDLLRRQGTPSAIPPEPGDYGHVKWKSRNSRDLCLSQ